MSHLKTERRENTARRTLQAPRYVRNQDNDYSMLLAYSDAQALVETTQTKAMA